MKSLSGRSKLAVNKKMSFLESLYLPKIIAGLWITFKHLFRKSVTVSFPEYVKIHSGVYRGQHVLKRDEKGAERCTACGLCAVACPAEAITMTAAERKPGEEKLYREEKYASTYEINMLRCIFCGLCEEACPKEAIFLTNRIVPTDYNRKGFIYGKDTLVEPVQARVDVSVRETPETLAFKKHSEFAHNKTFSG